MAQGIKTKQEDVKALVELVREEIELHKQGKINKLSSNRELGNMGSASRKSITTYLKKLSLEYRKYRTQKLQEQSGKIGGSIGGKIGGRINKEKGIGIFGINPKTGESYQVTGRKIAKEEGRGIYGIDPKTGESYRAIGRKITKEKGMGIYGISHINRVMNGRKGGKIGGSIGGKIGGKVGGRKAFESHRKNSYHVEGRFYASSQQEGAVALLLEKYLGYQTKDGENFQVRNNGLNNGGIDFLINNEFLEWHPIILISSRRRYISSAEEYKSYKKVLEALPESEKNQFKKDYEKVLAVNYRNSRQEAVDNSGYAGKNLTLITNVRGLYDFISRFSESLPSYDKFKREFNEKAKYVKRFKVKQENKSLQKQEAA